MLFTPAVNDARRDPCVVLACAAELRVQVLSLYQTYGDMVGHFIVGAAAEGHREGTKTGGTATDTFPSKQHLSEWRQLSARAVRQFGPKQVVNEMGAGS